MSFRLVSPTLRWIIFGFTISVFLLVSFAAGLIWYSDVLANSSKSPDWLRAAQLEPGNGDYWYRLGINTQLDLEIADPAQAITYLRKATDLNPRSANYWIALAGAYEAANDLAQARLAYQKAVSDYPSSSEGHWRYGSFLVRQGELAQGFVELHRALKIDPRLIPLAISRVWRATQNVDDLLNQVLPDTEAAQQQALSWLCSQGQIEPAMTTWKRMIASGWPIPIKTVFPLVEQLLAAVRGDDARQVWKEALIASGNAAGAETGDSLVFNGGFEYDAANGGLDWHLENVKGVTYDYETASQHSGKRALRVGFDGSQNFGFSGVWQDVPVQPNTKYHFEGHLRTGGITTDSGPRFVIGFADGKQPQIILENFTGDRPWELQQVDFTTGPEVQFVRIYVARPPSQRYTNKLAGFVWVDDVSLVPEGGRSSP